MKINMLIIIAVAIIFTVACNENEELITQNVTTGLKIPIEDKVQGKIINEMIGIDITNNTDIKLKSVTSGGLEDQYLIDDFNRDGRADVAVRRGNLIIIDTNRDGVSDLAFTFGNGSSERGYYTSNGGIAIVRNNSIFIDDNLDGLADRSFTYGNGNSDAQYIFMRPSGIAVRRADINPTANHIIVDYNMDGYSDVDFYWGLGDSENQYDHGFPFPSSGGWGLRRNQVWHFYNTVSTYSYGNGTSEDGYFLGKYTGNGTYYEAVLRGNTFYFDGNYDGVADGSFSFGTGLK